MREKLPVTGGCLCGAIRFEASVPPLAGTFCHCTMCRKSYGSLYQPFLRFPGDAFKYTKGQPKFHASSESGRRGFCAECGSPIAFMYEGNTSVWVLLGSLDHPEDWPLTHNAAWGPVSHHYVETKLPWLDLADGVVQKMSEQSAV